MSNLIENCHTRSLLIREIIFLVSLIKQDKNYYLPKIRLWLVLLIELQQKQLIL